ncbi:unnamed protein product [Effrenium voratum]|nr:unnamed protein product [Effrenium voratum]
MPRARFATARLDIDLPEGYPTTCGPLVKVTPGGLPEDAAAGAPSLEEVVESALRDAAGNEALFQLAEAVRTWLFDHGKLPEEPKAPTPEPPEEEGDDLDVDSEDLDEELIEALEDLLAGDAARRKELRRIRGLAPQSAEQKAALRRQLKMLSAEEREALVGSDSDSEPEPAKPRAPAVKLAPAQVECPKGHELTAFSARPPDYRKFDGDEYTCDLCGRDGEYRYGVYHCTKCFQQGGKQFDACPACGGGGGGGKPKGKKKR